MHAWLISPTRVVFRVTRDGTASRGAPKERSETSGPWYRFVPRRPAPRAGDGAHAGSSPATEAMGGGLYGCGHVRMGAEGSPRPPECPCLGSLHWGPKPPSKRGFFAELAPLRCLREVLVTAKAPAGGSAPRSPVPHHVSPHPSCAPPPPLCLPSIAEDLTFIFSPLQGLPGRDGVSGSPGEPGKDVSASYGFGGLCLTLAP